MDNSKLLRFIYDTGVNRIISEEEKAILGIENLKFLKYLIDTALIKIIDEKNQIEVTGTDNPTISDKANLFKKSRANGPNSRRIYVPEKKNHFSKGNQKLTKDSFNSIKKELKSGVPQREIASKHDISQKTVSMINTGKRKKTNNHKRLPDQDVLTIIAKIKDGQKINKIAKEFNRSTVSIYNIANKKTHKKLTKGGV